MSNAITELAKLDFDGKEWITELRNKLCENGDLSEEDIQEAFLKLNSTNVISNIEITPSSAINNATTKTLFKLSENKNVGGLYDDKVIEFSPVLSIIYGKNGSGKTSYYKVLKDAFHSGQNIYGNIYNYSALPTSAKIAFVDKQKHLSFQRKGIVTDFPGSEAETIEWFVRQKTNSLIKFCDSEILNSALIKKDTGWSIDRYKFEYYDKLRTAVEMVENRATAKLLEIDDLINSNLQILIDGLKSTLPDSIKANILASRTNKIRIQQVLSQVQSFTLPPDNDEMKSSLQVEANLSILDLTNEISLLTSKGLLLDNLLNYSSENTHIYANVAEICQKIDRLNLLRTQVDFSRFSSLNLVFDPIKNKDKYIEVIKKIGETAIAFGFQNYPNEIEKCFYCDQPLQEQSKKLIQDIHEIVNNEINREIEILRQELQQYISRLDSAIQNQLPNVELSEICETYDLHGNQIDVRNLQTESLSGGILKAIKAEVENLQIVSNVSSVWNDTELLYYLIKTEKALLTQKLTTLKERLISIEQLKTTASNKLMSLEDNEFCFAQSAVLQSIINCIRDYNNLLSSSSVFSGYKTKISRDKGRVENELIRNNYLVRFEENLEYFEIAKREKLKRYFSNPGGTSKIESKIESNGSQFEVAAILSEGEAKVFAFCDWLTELEFDDSQILVFDDPITSLDQVNIYKVVQKILELSSQYQVIVFTHNFEFYHRLVQQSLGGSPIQNAKCQICNTNSEANQCMGLSRATHKTHKCGSYFQIEHILQPGEVIEDVMFLTLNWEQRLEILRTNLLNGDIREADKHLRTTINNFFERFVLNDIKRQVYKNNDLIKEWRDMREISEGDYNILMDVHNKVSGEGTIHEPSEEVRTTLDVRGYILEFNKAVKAINNMRTYNNPSMSLINEITI